MPVDLITLEPRQDTWAKVSTAQASSLKRSEKYLIKAGHTLQVLADYQQVEGGHLKASSCKALPIGETFFLYRPDFPVSPQVLSVKGTIKIETPDGAGCDKIFPGSYLELEKLTQANPAKGDNYAEIVFKHEYEDRKEWRIYHTELSSKCVVNGTSSDNNPIAVANQSAPILTQSKWVKVPTFTCPNDGTRKSQVDLFAPILAGGHFTWSEATKGGARIPVSEAVMIGIVLAAGGMEDVRSLCGDRSVQVNSWYRDPDSNRAVGGALESRHLSGDAVDFVVQGLSSFAVYDILNPWLGSTGGLASSTIFTHIDWRGHFSRWSYGF